MDAARARALSLEQLEAFARALLKAYQGPDQLREMLFYRGKQHAVPHSDSFSSCVHTLIRTAWGEGWMHLLIDAVRKDRPESSFISDWLRDVRDPSAVSAGDTQLRELMDTAYFDLYHLRRRVARAARSAPARGGVIAFGFADPDEIFLHKFSDWLCTYFGEAQQKAALTLRPDLAALGQKLDLIKRYRRELETTSVLCVVRVDGGTPFWQAAGAAFAAAARRMILLFIGGPDAKFPPGITELPAPRFNIDDVDVWTHAVARRLGWPDEVAVAWTNAIELACWQGDECSVRALYEEMDAAIKDTYFYDEAAFRRRLEEGAGHAYAAPD